MAKTPNYNLELPDESRNISDEFPVLRDNLTLLDTALKEQSDAVEGKAPENHQHKIDEIQGLLNALNGKMSANKTFALTDMTDVKGANEAAINYVLTKTADGFGFSSATAALGAHKHKVEDIVGLTETLSGYGALEKANIWKSENKFYGNITISGSDRQQNRQYPYFIVRFPDGESSAGGLTLSPDKGGKKTELGYLSSGGIRVYVDGVGDVARFEASGTAWFMGMINCGINAGLAPDGNVRGDIWKGWGNEWAFYAIEKLIEDRAAAIADERKKWCVTDTRFASYGEAGFNPTSGVIPNNVPSGYVMCGFWKTNSYWVVINYRQPQVYYLGRGWVPLGGW